MYRVQFFEFDMHANTSAVKFVLYSYYIQGLMEMFIEHIVLCFIEWGIIDDSYEKEVQFETAISTISMQNGWEYRACIRYVMSSEAICKL